MTYFENGVPHEITVGALRKTLEGLPDHLIVAPNAVNELWVGTADGEMVGYISLGAFSHRDRDSTKNRMHWNMPDEAYDANGELSEESHDLHVQLILDRINENTT